MKLRLPHRLHAALVAALASVSFTTLCSGALTAAFFFGSQAFAEEADDNPGATIDIGDINLDAQAAIDEEEGKGEAKEPGSAPINQAGFNGIRGSSDDFDRQSTAEAATESSIDIENVGTADQANYGSTSADLPSDDLGFTANQYATDTESNVSGVMSQEIANPAAVQVTDTQLQATPKTTSSSSTSKISTLSVASSLGSLGGGYSGSSLGVSSPVNATPVLLGAVTTTVSSPTAGNAAGWFMHDTNTGEWRYSSNYSSNDPVTLGNSFSFLDENGAKISFNVGSRATYTFAFTVDLGKLSSETAQILLTAGSGETYNSGIGLNASRKLTESWQGGVAYSNHEFNALGDSGRVTIVHTAGEGGGYLYAITADGQTVVQGKNGWSNLKGNCSIQDFIMSDSLKNAIVTFGVWQADGTWNNADTLKQAALALNDMPPSEPLVWNGTDNNNVWTGTGVWKDGKTFQIGDSVIFGEPDAHTEVQVTNSVTAGTITVNNQYTIKINVASSGSLAASRLAVGNEAHLTVESNGGELALGSVSIADGASFTTTGSATSGTTIDGALKVNGGTLDISANLAVNGGNDGIGSGNNKAGLAIFGPGSTANINAGTTTVAGAVYIGNDDGMKASGATLNVGTGNTEAKLVTTRMELGDMQNGDAVNLNIGEKGSVIVTSDQDVTNYKQTGLVFSEWGTQTNASVLGNLYAQNVSLYQGDSAFQLTIDGTVAVKGIVNANNKGAATAITVNEGGKLVLGETGIEASTNGNWTITFNDGSEIGMSAATTSLDRPITLAGAVDFNTAQYEWSGSDADTTLIKPEKLDAIGGDMIIRGVIGGSGSLNKVGAGTLELTAANTYEGTTTVSEGMLVVSSGTLGRGNVTIKQGATLNAASGAVAQASRVTIENGGMGVVSDTLTSSNEARTMNVVVAEGGELHIKGEVGNENNGAWIDLPDHSGAGKVVLDSGTISYLSDLGGNTLVLASGSVLRFGEHKNTNKHEYTGNIELAGDATISVWGTSQHPNPSGVEVSGDVMGPDYKLSRFGGDNPITFTGNVSLGEYTVTKSEGDGNPTTFSGGSTSIGLLNSSQQTKFTGNAEVGTLSSAGNLVKSGDGTTLTLGGTQEYSGAVTVESGTLALANSMMLGDVTVNSGGTLQLTGNEGMLTTTGTFTLASGSTLDLSNYTFSGSEPITLVTTSGSGVIEGPGDWSNVHLVFNDNAPVSASLEVNDSHNLVLTYALETHDLIWDGGDDTWDVGTTRHWHAQDAQPGTSTFTQYDNVTFDGTGENATATLARDIHTGTMTLTNGDSTVTINTNGHNLTVDKLVSADAATDNKFTKRGTGTATFNGDGTAYFDTLTIGENAGTTVFNQHVVQTGNTRFEVSSDVTFNAGYEFTGTSTNDYALLVCNNSTTTLGGTSDMQDYNIGVNGGNGKVVIANGATVTANQFISDTTTLNNNGILDVEEGGTLHLKGRLWAKQFDLSGTVTVDGDTGTSNIATLNALGGTATFAEQGVTVGTLAASGGVHTTIDNKETLTANSLTFADNNTELEFSGHVKVTGGKRVEVGYNNGSRNNITATFSDGFDYKGGDSYALLIGNTDTVILGGDSDWSGKTMGMETSGRLILKENATVTVGRVHNSSTPTNNGTLVLENGSKFSMTSGNTTISQLENNGGTLEFADATTIAGAVTGDGTISFKGSANKILNLNGSVANYTGTLQNDSSAKLDVSLGAAANDVQMDIKSSQGAGVVDVKLATNTDYVFSGTVEVHDIYHDSGSANNLTVRGGVLHSSGTLSAESVTVGNGGTLRVTSSENIQAKEVTVNSGGTLDLRADSDLLVTSDTAVLTMNGGTFTNSGTGTSTLDIETLNVGSNGAIVSGKVNLGSEDDQIDTLTLHNTLISTGDNKLYADNVNFVGDLGESVGAGTTFKDTVSSSTDNGYVVSAKVVIVENASGTLTTNLAGKTITHDGWTYTLEQDDSSNIYISLMASTERTMQGDYYINKGTLTYGASDNATGLESTNTLFVNGGNLEFKDTDLKTGVALHVHKDGVVTLGEGRTLHEGAVHVKAGSTMTLDGQGTYALETAVLDAHGILPAGTVLKSGEDGFTGTVQVNKDSVLNGTDLSGLVNGSYSRVAFNGATGSLKAGTIAENIHLVDCGAQVALSLNTGMLGETHTFTGDITGTGTFARSYVNGQGSIGGEQNYEFSGNLEGWTGVFDNQVEGVDNTTNLTFSGNATVVNAEIKNGVAGSTGPLNVITTGSEGSEFNRSVTATSFTANGANATFNEDLRLTGDASATDGAKLVINDCATVGGNLSGDVQVSGTGNLAVHGAATLGDLEDNGTVRFSGPVSASGEITVAGTASLYLNGGGIALEDNASLTINSGSMVGLVGWTETEGVPTESGVVTTGFTGGQLYSGNGDHVTVATGSYFMKEGAEFLYTGDDDSRVVVHKDGENAGTVDIIEAIYYNVHTGDTKSMDDVKREAGEKALDYINIQSSGTLSGVTDENKGTYGIGNSGLQGSGTIAVGEGTLTDDASLYNFSGSIAVGKGATLQTDGTNDRSVSVNGGTYHATDDVDLGNNVTFSGRGEDASTIEVDASKEATITLRMTADLNKKGDGTLFITDLTSTGTRQAMVDGNLNVNAGTVVLASHRHPSDNAGVVSGNITMAGGTDVVMQGFDALGNSSNTSHPYTKSITMGTGSADNLTTLSFTRNGSDPETLQHTTLSTDIYMKGNTEMSGLRLNAFGRHDEKNLGEGSYVKATGMNNTISNTFAMRKNAYFEVADNSELTMLGNMELFDSGAESKKVIKTGTGVLDFAGENSTLHAIDIQAGTVEVTGNLTFTGPNANQFLMAKGAKFAVQNGATFNYREWLFENNDGTHAPGTVTAADRSTTYILEDANLVVSAMKLTNKNSGDQTINARLEGVQLMHTGGNVTINNATGDDATQHIASLTVKSGETTLHSATLVAASVNPGASLSFSAGETVELGSTILNGGTVNLKGTVNVQNLADFSAQSGSGYQDDIIEKGKKDDSHNGFYQGNTYYLVLKEGDGSALNVATDFSLTYQDKAVSSKGMEKDSQGQETQSYFFQVDEPNALYYINNTTANAEYTNAENPGNSMYTGYTRQVEQQEKHVDTTGIVMNVKDAVLTLATGLRSEVRTTTVDHPGSGIVAKQNGTIGINGGVTLHQSDLSGDSGVRVALVGAGTFDLVGTALKSVSSGLTDGSANGWRGTVRASGTADNMNATMMGNVNSTLLMDGVKGTLTNDDTQYVMKVVLQNGNGALTGKALDNTFSTGAHRTFTNTVSGSGDILMTGESSDARQSIAFTGDVSGWKGTVEDAAMFETASQGTTNLAFSGGASEVNIVIQEGEGSTLNLSVGPTNALEGQTPAQVFNGNIKASSLTAEAGANTTLNNTTAISGIIDATADNAKLHVQGTTTAQTVQVGNGQVGINDTAGTAMVDVSGRSGTAVMDGGLELASGEKLATIKGTATGALSSVDGANVKVLSEAASLKLENLVLSDDTLVRGQGGNGNLIISGMVEQQLSTKNTRSKNDTTIESALTMSGTTGTTMKYENGKVHNLDFTSMCQLARISGSAGTLVFDFTGMDGYNDWEHTFSAYGFIGVNFDPEVAMALKAANQQKEAINAADLQVVARTKDADGNLVERIGFYSNGGDGTVVGSVFYFQVPEPTTGTLSLLALAALAARRRRK